MLRAKLSRRRRHRFLAPWILGSTTALLGLSLASQTSAETINFSGLTAFPSALPPLDPLKSEDEPETLTLSMAIDRAMKNNPDVQSQKMGLRSSELTYDDAWDTMFMPSVSLNIGSIADKTLLQLPGTQGNPSVNEYGYPTSGLQLSLGQYTLFNFGRDRLVFEQARLEWIRAKEAFAESKRAVMFNVIIQFWTLKSTLDKLEAYNRSVDIARAIVDLQDSRLPLGLASQTDLSSSTVDLINSENLRNQTETQSKNALYLLNVLLGDPAGTRYRLKETIEFLPIKVTEDVLYETYLRESPSMKTARKDLTVAQMSLELKEKNNLPLPTIQFSGVTLGYAHSYYGNIPTGVSTQSGNPSSDPSNFDISAKINLSIPLLGPGGIFNRRSIEQAEIQVDQRELGLRTTANRDRQQILQLMQFIRQFENSVQNSQRSYGSSVTVLQSVFSNFMNTKTVSRLDIRDALNQARDSEIQLTDALVQHLNFKTQLAAFIGVDRLPRME